MGCCYSNEEDDRIPESSARPVYALSSPTPTASSSRVKYEPYRYHHKTVAPPNFRSVPIRNQVRTQPTVRAVVIKPTQDFQPKPGALYGEYKCGCGNFWVSRLSWRDRYQQCKRCKAYVRPRNQRELRPTDFTRGENEVGLEHPQELCEMCKHVGGYCGKYK